MRKTVIESILAELRAADEDAAFPKLKTVASPPPYRQVLDILGEVLSLLFPSAFEELSITHALPQARIERLFNMLTECFSAMGTEGTEEVAYGILASLPQIKRALLSDAIAIFEGDPAAYSIGEIITCYPGFYAIAVQRIAHRLYQNGLPFVPRMMTEHVHSRTGIDIHPGAEIGDSFCIDHGTGVVIGETAEIGNNVKIYQGVTVGARSFERDGDGKLIKGKKRHPTIGNNCIIYAGATILGGDTVVGDGCIIGGNVWLTHSLPSGSRVYFDKK